MISRITTANTNSKTFTGTLIKTKSLTDFVMNICPRERGPFLTLLDSPDIKRKIAAIKLPNGQEPTFRIKKSFLRKKFSVKATAENNSATSEITSKIKLRGETYVRRDNSVENIIDDALLAMRRATSRISDGKDYINTMLRKICQV